MTRQDRDKTKIKSRNGYQVWDIEVLERPGLNLRYHGYYVHDTTFSLMIQHLSYLIGITVREVSNMINQEDIFLKRHAKMPREVFPGPVDIGIYYSDFCETCNSGTTHVETFTPISKMKKILETVCIECGEIKGEAKILNRWGNKDE